MSALLCTVAGSLYRKQGFRPLLDSWRALDEDSMCFCMCPSWRMSSVETGRGNAVSLFSCARARRVKSCRGAHTHTVTVGSFSHTHNEAKLPGAGAGATGSWFSHSEPVLHLSLGLGLSRCDGAQSGWPLRCSIIIVLSTSSYLKYEDPWRYLILCIRWMICRIMVFLQFVS